MDGYFRATTHFCLAVSHLGLEKKKNPYRKAFHLVVVYRMIHKSPLWWLMSNYAIKENGFCDLWVNFSKYHSNHTVGSNTLKNIQSTSSSTRIA